MISEDLAARMQEIIRKHGDGYRKDLPGLIDQMGAHIDTLGAGGSVEVLPVLQREAHDMKGQAATFGLQSISAVASSISRILETNPSASPALTKILAMHVAALKILLEKDDPQLVSATLSAAETL